MGVVLLLALLLRLSLIFLPSFGSDMNSFMAWANHMVDVGSTPFYSTIWSDYAPGYLYILWGLGWVHRLVPQIPYELLLKLPAIGADIVIGFLIYRIIGRLGHLGYLGAILYLFNPAVIFNSSVWGQVDSVGALFVIAAVAALSVQRLASSDKSWRIREIVSFALLGMAVVVKPQMAVFIPIFLLRSPKLPRLLMGIGIIAAVVIGLSWPFFPNNPLFGLVEHLKTSVATYPYTSVFAMNFWGIFGTWKPDSVVVWGLSQRVWGMIMVVAIYVGIIPRLLKSPRSPMVFIQTLVIVAAGVFLFATRMHERYLFVLFPLLALLVGASGCFLWLYIVGAMLHFLNLYYVYSYYNPNFLKIPLITDLVGNNFGFFSLLMVGWYAVLVYQLSQKSKVKSPVFAKASAGEQNYNVKVKSFQTVINHSWFEFPQITSKPTKLQKYLLVAIFIAAIFTRFWRLEVPADYVFDEVYHAYTAQVMANNDPKAWEWWNDPPDSFAYEWTHPPFAKEAMVVGIKAFSWLPATLERIPNPDGGPPLGKEAGKTGDNPFGWRVPVALFSVGIVLTLYRLGKELFGVSAGLIAAFLATFDGLFLVSGRTGMNDTFFLFFQLLAVLFFIKSLRSPKSLRSLILTGIFLGLALSSKWTALYGIFLLGGIFLVVSSKNLVLSAFKKTKQLTTYYLLLTTICKFLLIFITIPAVVYLISYIPFFLAGHNWGQFIEVQRQMWWYHTNLKATHGYQSIALSWPLMIRPVWYYVKYGQGVIGNIYAMGNPVIWWAGVVAIAVAIATLVASIKQQVVSKKPLLLTTNYLLLLVAYLAFLVPWMFSPRIMFLYHYLPSLSFLMLIVAGMLSWLLRHSEQGKVFVFGFLFLVIVVFIYLYPHNTAMMVPTSWANQYYWLPSWR